MKIDAAKAYFILNYLQRGGEVYYEGRSLVWLDEYTVREDEKQRWVIDGFAIKTKSFSIEEWRSDDPDVGTDYFIGHDMSFNQFVEWVNNMSPVEYNRVIQELNKMEKTKE